MRNKFAIVVGLMIPLLGGCISTGGTNTPGDWERMAPTLQSRVRYVALFAFSMEQVKPHKQQVCEATNNLANFLDSYNDKDANFTGLRAAINLFINKIEDPMTKQVMLVVVDMVLTEAYEYAWKHYADFVESDPAQVAKIIAGSVANGLKDACGLSVMNLGAAQPNDIFTVSTR